MMFQSLALVALTAVTTVLANHQVTVYNYCGQAKKAHVKSSAFNYISGNLGTNGGSYSVSLPSLGTSRSTQSSHLTDTSASTSVLPHCLRRIWGMPW